MIADIDDIKDKRIFMVGIRGTGMSSLAYYFSVKGAHVTGSDSAEPFYTDEILQRAAIEVIESPNATALPKKCDLVIHSAAYSQKEHPQLRAASRRTIPLYSYPEAVGELSRHYYSVGIAGVHGKTTISGMCATIMRCRKLVGTALIGGAIQSLDGMPLLVQGDAFLLAETCEYRRHFHSYHPSMVLLSNIEMDHTDYFSTIEDIQDAFTQYALRLAPQGIVVYCADDPCVRDVVENILLNRADIRAVPYGHDAHGDYRIVHAAYAPRTTQFSLAKWKRRYFRLVIPGHHSVLNAAAAIAVCDQLPGTPPHENSRDRYSATRQAIKNYSGARRRSEIVGEYGGITIMDDYAHHPTAIQQTLRGLREFYTPNRIVVDFMPHTYSRTEALLDEFAVSFVDADIVYINDIYASAREKRKSTIKGSALKTAVARHHADVRYYPRFVDALPDCLQTLKKGDLFVTMGAGNNWILGVRLLAQLQET